MRPLKLYKITLNSDWLFAIFDSGPGHRVGGRPPNVTLPLIFTMVISSLGLENPLFIDRVNQIPDESI